RHLRGAPPRPVGQRDRRRLPRAHAERRGPERARARAGRPAAHGWRRMRILALRMAGFGPYRATQSVDFTRFEEDGIFLISGRTGSGKSSILDAVSFALYGDVPRFERRDQQ